MHRLNVLVIAALLAAAAVLGTSAVVHTTAHSAAHRVSVEGTVRTRTKQLNRFEAALQRELTRKPPALPAVPARPPAAPAPAPRVVYRRPPAVVVVRHSSYHEGEGESEGSDD
jgi:hypothetical protein